MPDATSCPLTLAVIVPSPHRGEALLAIAIEIGDAKSHPLEGACNRPVGCRRSPHLTYSTMLEVFS